MCGILAFLPVSCSDDSPVTGSPLLPEAPEGKVNVFLSLHKGSDYESPATRSGTAADETIMGPPWVLVFLGNDKDATFLEAVQARYDLGRRALCTIKCLQFFSGFAVDFKCR